MARQHDWRVRGVIHVKRMRELGLELLILNAIFPVEGKFHHSRYFNVTNAGWRRTIIGMDMHTRMVPQDFLKSPDLVIKQVVQSVEFQDDDPETVHIGLGQRVQRLVFPAFDVHLQNQVASGFFYRFPDLIIHRDEIFNGLIPNEGVTEMKTGMIMFRSINGSICEEDIHSVLGAL